MFLQGSYLNGHRAREKMLHVLSHETHTRCHFTLVRVFLPNKANHNECRVWTNANLTHGRRGQEMTKAPWGSPVVSQEVTELPLDSTILVPGVRSGELNKCVHAETCTALFVKAPKWKNPNVRQQMSGQTKHVPAAPCSAIGHKQQSGVATAPAWTGLVNTTQVGRARHSSLLTAGFQLRKISGRGQSTATGAAQRWPGGGGRRNGDRE